MNNAQLSQLSRTQAYSAPSPAALWRSLFFFNIYRILLGGVLVFVFGTLGNAALLGVSNRALFVGTSIGYFVLACGMQLAIRLRRPDFNIQLAALILLDISCVTLLLYASSGIQSGLGILLLVPLAASGLISRGRISLFFAAMASIAVLLEHTYAVLTAEGDPAQYMQVGLLCIAYFAVAWMANTLARYAVTSEELASRRGTELASMAEANRLVIQGMPDGVLVVDELGGIRQYNPSAERLLGSAIDNIGMNLGHCSRELGELYALWHREQFRGPRKIQMPGGATVHARFLPVRHGDFLGALLLLEDVQRIQAQAQQFKLAAMGRLTASIAHEIRNPLSAISYAAELLNEGHHEPGQDRLIKAVLDNATRLGNIVRDVMQLNRRDRAQPESLRLQEVLPRFAEEVCQAKQVQGGILQLEVAADCTVRFDRGHLYQVLWNLCSNALRYCQGQAGSVRVQAWQAGDGKVILQVRDDGVGVAPGRVQQLFEPFFTTDASGTGLGLYIARELCEANEAKLEYVQEVGQGACFRITFGGGDEY